MNNECFPTHGSHLVLSSFPDSRLLISSKQKVLKNQDFFKGIIIDLVQTKKANLISIERLAETHIHYSVFGWFDNMPPRLML